MDKYQTFEYDVIPGLHIELAGILEDGFSATLEHHFGQIVHDGRSADTHIIEPVVDF